MNDLIIDCKFKNGPSLIRGFDTIMNFIEAYEQGQFSRMEKNIKSVKVKNKDGGDHNGKVQQGIQGRGAQAV